LSEYWLAQLTFVLIYAIVGLGLMLLAGFTGQFSIGHAAFLGVGAYTQAVLTNPGWPFPLALACAPAAVGGVGRGGRRAGAARQGHLPGHRHAGLRLHRRRGVRALGKRDRRQRRHARQGAGHLRLEARHRRRFYFLCLVLCRAGTLGVLNLLRSPTGRAFVAIRDSEISAQSMGIHLARYKTLSFALSAALAGMGGALYAHKMQVPVARPVQHHAVDRPAADGGDRRAGLGARRVPGRHLPDHHAAAHRAGARTTCPTPSARRRACRPWSTARC
jgi:branched-chain amino acid transport system permease protein